MLVYGDRSERADPEQRLRKIAEDCASVAGMEPGLPRHARLVSILIEAGRLLQGLADADFDLVGYDRQTGAIECRTGFLMKAARAVCDSWDSQYLGSVDLPMPPTLRDLPASVDLRVPEGFAFYALYPEAYADAARALRLHAPPRVIGIRSIGTSLAAIVAAAIDAPPPVTVRPFGDPFARRVALSAALEEQLLAQDAHFIIVDEGPGQSGSSFGAVADWLQHRGVPLDRIAVLPSHPAGPGVQASDRQRARWRRAQKAVADLGPKLPGLVEDWVRDLLGPLDAPLQALSAGRWRARAYRRERDWPAATPAWERRKYLASAAGRQFLLKFAGLGEEGERKLRQARLLHDARLTPEPLGVRHGFLIETWHSGAQRLTAGDRPLAEIAHYLGTRARLLSNGRAAGASLRALFEMAVSNAREALGEHCAGTLRCWAGRLDALEARVQRFPSDGRMQPHEWLRLADGRLLKTDALDHHCGHDLVGAQGLAWDVAGASVEFGLDERETAWLAGETGRTAGQAVDPELLDFLTDCYLAFRIGQDRMAVAMCAVDAPERGRLERRAQAYENRLSERLNATATRRENALGGRPERTGGGTIAAALG